MNFYVPLPYSGDVFNTSKTHMTGFPLQGASVSIDTACSSSLVTTHFAAAAITSGRATGGLSAGVNLPMNWETSFMFAAAAMMAPDGRCRTLDAGADGYVRSEACVAIKLRCATKHQNRNVRLQC